jgi:hypothetical protein
MSKKRAPKYIRKVIDRTRQRQLPSGLLLLNVLHDDDCAIWKGGPCDCRPEVRIPAHEEGI